MAEALRKTIEDSGFAIEAEALEAAARATTGFAHLMSRCADVVPVGDIARTLGKTTGYLSPYRRQLIARQIIEPTAPGYLTFSIPFMKDYLTTHASEIRARYGERERDACMLAMHNV